MKKFGLSLLIKYIWRKKGFKKPPIEKACFEMHFKQGQLMIHDQNVEILLLRNHIDKNTRSKKVWFSGNRPDLYEIH